MNSLARPENLWNHRNKQDALFYLCSSVCPAAVPDFSGILPTANPTLFPTGSPRVPTISPVASAPTVQESKLPSVFFPLMGLLVFVVVSLVAIERNLTRLLNDIAFVTENYSI